MRNSRLPSLLSSAALHLAVFLAAFITWPMWSRPITFSEAVPITIVAQAPSADVRPAEKAETVQTAAAPEPEPSPEPEPPAPQPAPEPRPAPPPKPRMLVICRIVLLSFLSLACETTVPPALFRTQPVRASWHITASDARITRSDCGG